MRFPVVVSSALLLTSLGFSTLAREPLTFEERVKAQEAIERVYYEHRIWPKENPGPKPPFEQIVPKTKIEAKVTDYLKKSVALDQFWQRPITREDLQAEIDRMALGTKDPATLLELYAALDDDPALIAECLAGPVLANRLVGNLYAYDARFHADVKAAAESARRAITPDTFGNYPSGECYRAIYLRQHDSETLADVESRSRAGTWVLDPEAFNRIREASPSEGTVAFEETPEGFILTHVLEVTDNEIRVERRLFAKKPFTDWWPEIMSTIRLSDAAPATRSDVAFRVPQPAGSCDEQWAGGTLAWPGVPDGRLWHSVVWTGAEMVIWGGYSAGSGCFNSGGRYNPSTDTWVMTATGANCPIGRYNHTAVWTGTEMVVWGGVYGGGSPLGTGGRYNPSTDTWTTTSTGIDCPSARRYHSAVWTGTEMIVWGGDISSGFTNTGGRYNPSSDTWIPTSIGAGCPQSRCCHSVVWTGSEMLVWGGAVNGSPYHVNTGGRYNPSTNSWVTIPTGTNCPVARRDHTAVWTGSEMIVWGGMFNGSPNHLNTGGRFNPSTNSWTTTSTGVNCPSARFWHTAVWTGTGMVVWGGNDDSVCLNTGGIFDPLTDSWTVTSDGPNCPLARDSHGAVWTGTEMIVWGGSQSSGPSNTGGRFNPTTNNWIATSIGTGPSGRREHTAVWTGIEMLVWGGLDYNGYLNTGVLYLPSTDSWSPTSTGSNCPSGRYEATSIWTGTELVVWGGSEASGFANTGGRYNPASDTWIATSVGPNSPSGRSNHTAVWTGSEMIVWGGYDGNLQNTGGRYNPMGDSWLATSTGQYCPSGRGSHTAVWTGSEMIVWGGSGVNTGGRYNPLTDSWTETSVGTDCPSGRGVHAAVWTGDEMIIWGGSTVTTSLNTGGRYNPSSNTWVATSTGANCPSGRGACTAIWTGSEMIVWGGYDGTRQNTGGRYNPYAPYDSAWKVTSIGVNCPTGRDGHTAIWTGKQMVIWGGDSLASLPHGGLYSPDLTSPYISGPNQACLSGFLNTATYSTYQWYRNGTAILGATSRSYFAPVPGIYKVWVTNSSNCGIFSTDFVVSGNPAPVISGPSTGCDSVSLSTSIFSSYQWIRDGADIPGATAQVYTAYASGTYTVRVSNAAGCLGTSAGKAVILQGAMPTITGPQVNTCPDTRVRLAATGVYATYRWNYMGAPIPGASLQMYDATASGNYTVTVGDGTGCEGTSADYPVFIDFCATSEISPPGAIYPARLVADGNSSTGYYLYWQRLDTLMGYNVYEGALGATFTYDTAPLARCNVAAVDLGTGEIRVEITPSAGNHYYLVTAFNVADEGPSGYASNGTEIPPAYSTCGP